MIPFNTLFNPSAATIRVSLQNPFHRQRKIFSEAIIDTGAEFTAIPKTIITNLSLNRKGAIKIKGIEEQEGLYNSYVINLQIADTQLERRLVIGWLGDFVIVGRDLLSEFTFTYDGKNRKFEILDP